MATLSIDAERFEALRADQGLDLDKDLAMALGVSKSTVSRIVRGEAAPGVGFIAAALQTFPVKFEDIFEIVEKRHPVVLRAQKTRSPRHEEMQAAA